MARPLRIQYPGAACEVYGVKSFPVTKKPKTRIETYAEDHM
jgi:hypothetical protein